MSHFIELNYQQASMLLEASYRERNRIRHEAEPWPSQAERDAARRDEAMEKAERLGVPREQIERFVFAEVSE